MSIDDIHEPDLEQSLRELLDSYSDRMQGRFQAVGIQIDWTIGEKIGIRLVALRPALGPAVHPPTKMK